MSTLLDTNIVSEQMRKSPEHSVARWVSDHPVEDMFLSSVSEAELRNGSATLPLGRCRETLLFKIEAMLGGAFEDRALPFDSNAARAYGYIAAACRSAGRPVASPDCQIAARSVRDFEDLGIEIVNPWAGA